MVTGAKKLRLFIIISGIMICPGYLFSQEDYNDTTDINLLYKERYDQFYDSLRLKAQRSDVTRWIHNAIIKQPREQVDKEQLTLGYFLQYNDKIISDIEIIPLEAFGRSLNDTTRKTKSKLQEFASNLHTTTNPNIIRKNLIIKVGDKLDPAILYENERIIRMLPYIKDVRVILTSDSLNSEFVKVTVLTKDKYAFGITGSADGIKQASFEIYNQNIFGTGHELTVNMVGHLRHSPFLGFETFYKIPNIAGRFVNFSIGFSDTYKKRGYSLALDKEFLTPTTKMAYGLSALRLKGADRLTIQDPIRLDSLILDYYRIEGWLGKSFQINKGSYSNSQLTISANMIHQYFYKRPPPGKDNKQYFSNSTSYYAGISWSKRNYMRDQLIYGYGITEDIPEGYKYEVAVGFDANEFGDRYYAHLIFENGNLLPRRPGYLYALVAVGGYFNKSVYEQGIIKLNANYISRLITAGKKRYRFFASLNYTIGINRFDIENLYLRYDDHIRGFRSKLPSGHQRLSMNLEAVFFQHKQIYNFNIAFYAFSDIAIIGNNKESIFRQDYYAGVGLGMRLHNESLVLRTLEVRLSFYPNHPSNMSLFGFNFEEQLKNDFYSFQPDAPMPIYFR